MTDPDIIAQAGEACKMLAGLDTVQKDRGNGYYTMFDLLPKLWAEAKKLQVENKTLKLGEKTVNKLILQGRTAEEMRLWGKTMSNIADRLEASLQHGAINDDSFERGIVGEQINEAILEIRLLRKETQKLMEAAKVERAMKLNFLTPKTTAAMIEAWNHCGNDIRKDLINRAESELRAEGVIK